MNLGEFLVLGGWPMLPIYLCSVVALTVFLGKLFELSRTERAGLDWLGPVIAELEAGDLRAAQARCSRARHPAARVLQAAIRVESRRPDRVVAEAARVGSLEVQHFDRHLGVLGFIAQAAPLLGLLGTVIGMVRLFFDLEASPGMADAAQLSSGIWQALLTTAAGLVVAVPTLAAHSYLGARSDSLRLALHDAVERGITAMPATRTNGDGTRAV